jgi:hypothetical protein
LSLEPRLPAGVLVPGCYRKRFNVRTVDDYNGCRPALGPSVEDLLSTNVYLVGDGRIDDVASLILAKLEKDTDSLR